MKKSTSIHSLNADTGLSKPKKLAYLFLNWVNNLFPYWNIDRRIKMEHFAPANLDELWPKTHKESSAARKLSDLFWMSLPWENIEEELGKIHVFDTGCGSGNYGVRLLESSGGRVASYTGIDAKERPNWKVLMEKYPGFNLIRSRSNDIRPLIPADTNLFITQTAIEHFDNDIFFFEQIRDFIEKSGRPVTQIHIFPAASTLPLYLFHGFRQYTPRNISKITRLFGDEYELKLIGMGGRQSKIVHWRHFTWPVLILRKTAKPSPGPAYDEELHRAVEEDGKHAARSPLFWALMINYRPRRKE